MKVGSLFSGYGGLDMAVGGELAWYSEIEPAACKILKQHNPGIQNLGDIKKVNWSKVDPVDVITGGYPCQPFSQAGLRKGESDERHLWPFVRDAICELRPKYAVLENVSGHLTLGFANVLADLASIGFNARWTVVRASDVGAVHARKRLFFVAYSNSVTDGFGTSGILENSDKETFSGGKPISDFGPWVGDSNDENEVGVDKGIAWGKYEFAVKRWERVFGRAAPEPTFTHNGKPRLNPVFVEWVMGLPDGHVTKRGLTWAQELKILGNGVVPQQARFALDRLFSIDGRNK